MELKPGPRLADLRRMRPRRPVSRARTKTDGKRFRHTEILSFDGEKISKVEVYFGWNLT